MTNCTECSRRITAKNSAKTITGADYADVCVTCYDYWGWENAHSDGDHDNLPADDRERVGCKVCERDAGTAVVDVPAPVATGRRNMSHADCDHAKTTAARTACRRARG